MGNKVNEVVFKGIIQTRSESKNLLKNSGEFVIVEREVPRLMIMRCPCGCGDDLLINLDKRSGPAWRLYVRKSTYTLSPSYWRESECRSHFILWSNKIYWCNWDRDDEFEYSWFVDKETELKVLNKLSKIEYSHYLDLADQCDLISWECLQACKQLLRKGLCVAKKGKHLEYFRKSE